MSTELEPPLTDEALCRLSTVVAPLPATLPQPPALPDNAARWMFERLAIYIKQFESALDDEHEIGARLVSFGHNLTFHIEDMGYYGPDMIVFYGKNDNGEPVQLIQHTSQLSVLLVAVRSRRSGRAGSGSSWTRSRVGWCSQPRLRRVSRQCGVR